MRSSFLRALAVAAICLAATAARSAEAVPVPVPAGAKVRFDLEARDGDLLGLLKTLLKGVNGPVLAVVAGAPAAATDPAVARLSLADTLREIHHFRLVGLELGAGGAGPDQLLRFYEEPFLAAGGRRLLLADAGGAKFLAVDFPQARRWAAVFLLPGGLLVAQADGYPNLESVPALLALLYRASTGPGEYAVPVLELIEAIVRIAPSVAERLPSPAALAHQTQAGVNMLRARFRSVR